MKPKDARGTLKQETRQVSGVTLETEQLPPRAALRLLWDIGRSAPFIIARLEGAMKTEDIVNALQETLIRLSSDEFEALYMRALKFTVATLADGSVLNLSQPEMVDRAFEGNIEGLCNAIAFAVEVNFAGFMNGALASWMPRAAAPKEKAE